MDLVVVGNHLCFISVPDRFPGFSGSLVGSVVVSLVGSRGLALGSLMGSLGSLLARSGLVALAFLFPLLPPQPTFYHALRCVMDSIVGSRLACHRLPQTLAWMSWRAPTDAYNAASVEDEPINWKDHVMEPLPKRTKHKEQTPKVNKTKWAWTFTPRDFRIFLGPPPCWHNDKRVGCPSWYSPRELRELSAAYTYSIAIEHDTEPEFLEAVPKKNIQNVHYIKLKFTCGKRAVYKNTKTGTTRVLYELEAVCRFLCDDGNIEEHEPLWMITFAPSLHGIFVVSIDMDNNDDHSRSLVVPLMYRLRFGKSQRTKPFPFAL